MGNARSLVGGAAGRGRRGRRDGGARLPARAAAPRAGGARAGAGDDLGGRDQRSPRPHRGAAPLRRLPRQPAPRAHPRRRRGLAGRRGRHVPGDAPLQLERRGGGRPRLQRPRLRRCRARQPRVRLRPGGPAVTATQKPGDDPRGALRARAAEATFPFLDANLVDAATGAPPAWKNVVPDLLLTSPGSRSASSASPPPARRAPRWPPTSPAWG